MSNERIESHFTPHDLLNQPGDFGPTFPATEGCATPVSSSNQLERPKKGTKYSKLHIDMEQTRVLKN